MALKAVLSPQITHGVLASDVVMPRAHAACAACRSSSCTSQVSPATSRAGRRPAPLFCIRYHVCLCSLLQHRTLSAGIAVLIPFTPTIITDFLASKHSIDGQVCCLHRHALLVPGQACCQICLSPITGSQIPAEDNVVMCLPRCCQFYVSQMA